MKQKLPLFLCLSHLRWHFVYQRPQHLIAQASALYTVVFFEEPLLGEATDPTLRLQTSQEGVLIATPLLPEAMTDVAADAAVTILLDKLLADLQAPLAVCWYYTPLALAFAGHLRPTTTVFDIMDELSAFDHASPRLSLLERRLLKVADLAFTGGRSLYEAKRHLHPSMHLFPSSVDTSHFCKARSGEIAAPADQAGVAAPRIGFFGVVDERMDLALVAGIAAQRPEWQIVMLGPVVKIDPASLPRGTNLHWLGIKAYTELPSYLAGWNAGFMPFALNKATRYISPTKTPEFLSAGLPVVSTSVPDVVHDWGRDGLVDIADGLDAVVAAIETILQRPKQPWLAMVDERLAKQSWTFTWSRMHELIERCSPEPKRVGQAT